MTIEWQRRALLFGVRLGIIGAWRRRAGFRRSDRARIDLRKEPKSGRSEGAMEIGEYAVEIERNAHGLASLSAPGCRLLTRFQFGVWIRGVNGDRQDDDEERSVAGHLEAELDKRLCGDSNQRGHRARA